MSRKNNVSRDKANKAMESKSDIHKKLERNPSLKYLIIWNVTKALKHNPKMDLRTALRKTQKDVEKSHNVETMMAPDMHNMLCAFLAWQRLGHHNADSLFSFIEQSLSEKKGNEDAKYISKPLTEESGNPGNPSACFANSRSSMAEHEWGNPPKVDFSTSTGLVVKLPQEPQTVMRLTGPIKVNPKKVLRQAPASVNCKPQRAPTPKERPCTNSKIVSACALNNCCMERLAMMEGDTENLRQRAARVARCGCQRIEQLERAELAWRDLEASYHRRLKVYKDKEEEIEKQVRQSIAERKNLRQACIPLVSLMAHKSEEADEAQRKLTALDQVVCSMACQRLEMIKTNAQIEAQLTQSHCKAAQFDRDLQIKEEQERRAQRFLASEMEAAQVLTHEVEYAHHEELASLKAQVEQATQELLDETARTSEIKQRVAEYLDEKNELIEDLEACQTKCDGRMVQLTNELKNKREQLSKLEKTVIECLCKEPVDREVEVRRTPSLAALCKCSPSDIVQDSCSCTSLRSRLISALLKDLFGGLKLEMEDTGIHMPCSLLKCLEDKHNWDRASNVKTNIRDYFSRLLLGELDIAIARIIEHCHAQWMTECCVDWKKASLQRIPSSKHSSRWQEHEIEVKTQKMAAKLAEKMFQEKAQELAQQAQDILTKDGNPPCECGLKDIEETLNTGAVVYRCEMPSPPIRHKTKNGNIASSADRHKTVPQPVQVQIQQGRKNAKGNVTSHQNTLQLTAKGRKKDVRVARPEITVKNYGCTSKPTAIRRCPITNKLKKTNKCLVCKGEVTKDGIDELDTSWKESHQYAVNMCLCDSKINFNWKNEPTKSCSHRSATPISISSKKSKPNISPPLEFDMNTSTLCREKGGCLHKAPSNTSVNRLLDILSKWKDNLLESQESNIKEALNTDSLFKITHTSIVNVLQQLCGQKISKKSVTNLEQPAISHDKAEYDGKNTMNDCIRTETPTCLPIHQSQYIAAVNLDSNDFSYMNQESNTNVPFQCIQPPTCAGNRAMCAETQVQMIEMHTITPTQNKANKEKNSDQAGFMVNKIISTPVLSDCENCIKCLGVILTNATSTRLLSTGAKHVKQNEDRSNRRSLSNNDNGDMMNPNDFGNHIQFLGVTLDNPKTKIYSNIDSRQQNNNNDRAHHKNGFLNRDGGFKTNANKKFLKSRRTSNKQSMSSNVLHLHNECSNNVRSDKVDHLCLNKSVEAIEKRNEILNNEPCICCMNIDASVSKDLEINAFQLLEDHLNRRIKELKLSVCKASCMQGVDEKNAVNDTLIKVKELILESASGVNCKCPESTLLSGGSWNRAHILLQEYLKTKIMRVKCLCNSSGNSPNENLVPYILSKINLLIENDLQRLKNSCKCKNTTTFNKPMLDEPKMEVTYELKSNAEVVNSINYEKQLSLPYNKSAQVSLHRSVVTRSCNALEIESTYCGVQTIEIMKDIVKEIDNDSLRNDEEKKDECNKSAQVSLVQPMATKSCNAWEAQSGFPEVQTIDLMSLIDNESDQSVDVTKDDKKGSKKGSDTNIYYEIYNLIKENLPDRQNMLVDDHLFDQQKLDHLDNSDKKAIESYISYIGCTINCCCDNKLACVCTKSAVATNTDELKNYNICETVLQKNNTSVPEDLSYTLGSQSNKFIKDKPEKNNTYNPIQDKSAVYINATIMNLDNSNQTIETKTHTTQAIETKVCEVSATEENHIYLKISNQELHSIHDSTATTTLSHDKSLQSIPVPYQIEHCGIFKPKKNVLRLLQTKKIPSEVTIRL